MKINFIRAFEDNYIKGKYGAIPYLGLFDSLHLDLPEYEHIEHEEKRK